MANRYWVGGTGTWDTTTTTNWSASSGGGGGASVPTAADSVFFDQAATYTVTMTGALNCLDITVSAGTVTFATGTTPTLSVAGNWSTIAGTVWNTTGAVTFTATTAKTLTSGGITINSPFTFNGVGGSWTLQDNFTFGSTLTTTLTAGTLALGTFTLTTGLFASSNSNTRVLNFGTGKIALKSATTSTVWTTATVTGLTVSGTPLVECSGGGTAVTKTINTGALSEANSISFSLLETTGTVTYAFTASNTVKNLIINGLQTLSNIAITIYGAFTHSTANGTTTFTAGANAWTFGATSGSIAITNLAGTTYDFPWTFGSAASTATWTLGANLTLGATRALTLVTGTFDFNSKTLTGTNGISINNTAGTFTLANTGTASLSVTQPISFVTGTFTLPFNVTTTSTFTCYSGTLTGTLNLNNNILTATTFTTAATTGAKTLAFGTGKIVLNGNATATVFSLASAVANITVTGTPLVECIGGGTAVTKTITPGAATEANSISFSLLETTGTVTYTITTATSNVRNLIVNGSQTLSNSNIGIWGDFTHSTANGTTTFTAGANAWVFAATSGARAITNIAGFTYDFPWTFGSAASTATWTLGANLTLGATRQLTLTNGTIDFNSKTISAAGITILTGNPSIANTGTASFTTTLPITHTSGSLTLPFNFTTSSASGYTFSAGTLALGTFTLTTPVFVSNSATARTLNFGTGKIVLNGSTTATIFNMSTVTGLTVSGTPLVECIGGGTGVTKTINISASAVQAQAISFSLLETTGTVTYATTAGCVFYNLLLNGSQTLNTSAGQIWLLGFTHLTTNGTTTITATANVWQFYANGLSVTINPLAGFTYDLPWTIGNSTYSATYTLTQNLTLGATRQLTFINSTFDFNSKTFSGGGITINNTGGTFTLANTGTGSFTTTLPFTHTSGTFTLPFAVTTSAATGYTFTAGTLALSTFTLTTPVFVSSGATARTLNYGTGQLALTGNGATIFDVTTATNFTTSGTVYVNCTYTGSTGTRTLVTGFTLAQAASYNVATSGTTGIVLSPSATDTVALTGNFNNVDLTGFTGTLTNTARTLYGDLTIPATTTLTAGTNATTFGATSGTKTITTNGKTLDFPITFNGAGGTFQLADATTIGSTRTTTLTAGTLNLNNFVLSTGAFSSLGAGVRTLAFSTTGQLALTGSGVTILDLTTTTNLTVSGTLYINCTYAGAIGTRTIVTGLTEVQSTGFDVATSGTSGIVLSPSATDIVALTGNFNSINLTGFTGTLSNTARTLYGSLTVPAAGGTLTAGTAATTFAATSGVDTITTNGRTLDFPIIFNGVGGTFRLGDNLTLGATRAITLTAGTFDLNDLTSTSLSLSSSGTGVRAISFGTLGQITLVGNAATILDFTTATNFTYTGTPRIYSNYNGATGTRTFNFGGTAGATTTNDFDVNIGTSGTGIVIRPGTDSIDLLGVYNNVDLTGLTMTIPNTAKTIYGNLTIPNSGGTFTAGATAWTLAGPSTQTVTTNARTLDFPITVGNGTSVGTAQLAGALTLGSTRTFTLTSGNIDFNNFTLTANVYAANGTATRRMVFGSTGQLTLVGSGGTIISMPTATGFSYTGTPKILSSYAGATGTRTFALGNAAAISIGNTFPFNINGSNGIIIAGGTDTLTVVGQTSDFDLRNSTNIVTNDAKTIYGNFYTSGTGGTINAGANALTFAGYSGNYTIDSANRVLDFPFTIDGNGNYNLNNSYIAGSSSTVSTRAVTLNTGNFTINNVVLYCGQFVTTGANIRSINFSGTTGTMNLMNSNTTIWNSNNASNLSLLGNLIINSTYTSNVGTRVFDFGNIAEAYAQNVQVTTGTNGFNINTANDSVTLTGSIGSLNLTGLLATVTNTSRTIYGNLTIPATGGTFTAGTTATVFGSTSGNETIDTQGRTLQFPFTFNGVGGNWTLANNLVANATTALTLTNGQVDFNQKTLTYANITVLTGNAGLSNLSTTLNFVHTSGNLTPLSGAINSATTGTYAIAAGLLSANAPFTTGAFTLTAGAVNANATLTTGAFTHTAGNMSVLTGGTVNTQAYTQNGGNIILNGGDLVTTTFTSNSGTTRSITFTNGNINATSTGTVVNMANTTALTSTVTIGNINITSAGSTAITVTPGALAQANAMNYNITAGTYALTISAANAVRNLNFTGFAGSVVDTAANIYGNLTLASGMTITGANALTLTGTLDQNLTTNGVTLDRPVTINKTGGTFTVADTSNIGATRAFILTAGNMSVNSALNANGAFTFTAGNLTTNATMTTGAFTHTAGNLTVNTGIANTQAYTQNGGNIILSGNDLVTTTFTSNSGTTRTIQLGTSNINVTSTGTVINMANTTALTANGTGNFNVTNAGSTAITVTPGALAQANSVNINIIAGTYALTISAANAVKNLNFTGFTGSVVDTAANIYGNLTLGSGMTITGANALTLTGTLDQNLTTTGITLDRPITVNKTGGTFTVADTSNIGSTRTTTLTAGNMSVNANFTAQGAFTFTAGNLTTNAAATVGAFTHTAGNLTINTNGKLTTNAYTQNGGNIVLTGNDLVSTTFTSNSGTARSITFTNGNINATSTGTVINMANSTAFTSSGNGGFNITSAGSTAITVTPGTPAQGNAVNLNFVAGTYPLTITALSNVRSLNFTGFTGSVVDTAANIVGNGNLILGSGMTISGASVFNFDGTSDQKIVTNGVTLDRPITVRKTNGVLYFDDVANLGTSRTFTISTGSVTTNAAVTTGPFVANASLAGDTLTVNAALTTQTFTHTQGTVTLNANLNPTTYISNSGLTRTFNFNNSNINITGTTGVICNVTPTINELTFTGSRNFIITSTASTAITVTGGNTTNSRSNYYFTGGTYALSLNQTDNLDFTGFSGSLADTSLSVYGNLKLSSSMTITGANAITFSGTPDQVITTNGITIDKPITASKANILYFADTANLGTSRTLSIGSGSTVTANATWNIGVVSLVSGNFYANNTTTTQAVTVTAGNFLANGTVTTQAFTQNGGNVYANGSLSTQAYTHNSGNLILAVDLLATAFTSSNTTTRTLQFGSNVINVSGTGTVANFATLTGLTVTGTKVINITNAGSTAITVTPGSPVAANAMDFNFKAGTYALTLTGGNVNNLNFTGYAGTLGDSAVTIYGNLTFSTGMTRTAGTSAYTFASTSTQYITTNGKLFDFPITINGVGGTVSLNDSMTVGSTRVTTLTNGNLDLNGLTYTTGLFSTAAGTKSIIFDDASLVISGSGATAFNNASTAGFTINVGTGTTPTIKMTSSTAKTFVGGSFVYNAKLDQAGAGDLTITGTNTFDSLLFTYGSTGNANIIMPAGVTTTITNSIANGTANTKLFGLMGSSGTRANLNYTNYTTGNILLNYINAANIMFLPNTASFVTDGTFNWKWYVGANSINSGNVLGAIFADNNGSTGPILYLITSGTSWTVPADWNSANNQIHLWGAGGGGAGGFDYSAPIPPGGSTYVGGGGGGGGGYTKVTNFSASGGSTVTYSLGAGGTGGTWTPSHANGANGGNTTFSSFVAQGGKGGTASFNPGTGGVGGIGGTFNGGAGGNGFSANNVSVGGGGGGGAGGPFGVGGKGGTGDSILTANTQAGAGGGGSGGGTAGSNASSPNGGAGGNNVNGVGGGAGGTTAGGSRGGGGGGSSNGGANAASGSFGVDVLNSIGGGGGGGGTGNGKVPPVGSGTYAFGGGGGGASHSTQPFNPAQGGQGGSGGIVIVYYPTGITVSSSMFLIF